VQEVVLVVVQVLPSLVREYLIVLLDLQYFMVVVVAPVAVLVLYTPLLLQQTLVWVVLRELVLLLAVFLEILASSLLDI
jgi:hypothetical protein